MILRSDGYLDENLAPYPGGLEESLAKKFGRNRWNGVHGLSLRDEDDTTEEEEQRWMNENARPTTAPCYPSNSTLFSRNRQESFAGKAQKSKVCPGGAL
jgi:hypothetical protein